MYLGCFASSSSAARIWLMADFSTDSLTCRWPQTASSSSSLVTSCPGRRASSHSTENARGGSSSTWALALQPGVGFVEFEPVESHQQGLGLAHRVVGIGLEATVANPTAMAPVPARQHATNGIKTVSRHRAGRHRATDVPSLLGQPPSIPTDHKDPPCNRTLLPCSHASGFDTDVLIVGAGPTGLTLATALAARGVRATVIDRQAEGANTSRAAVVHARTLEVLEPLGVAPTLVARGIQAQRFTIRDRDRVLVPIGFDDLPTPLPVHADGVAGGHRERAARALRRARRARAAARARWST